MNTTLRFMSLDQLQAMGGYMPLKLLLVLWLTFAHGEKAAEGYLLMCNLGESSVRITYVIILPWYGAIDSEVEKQEASRHETLHGASY